MQSNEEYLAKKATIVNKLRGNLKAINQFRKLYNELCQSCKAKVLKNPQLPLEEYCQQCQNKAIYRIEKVQEELR